MQLSAPIHRLKHAAKSQARTEGIALHDALNRIAVSEGFQSWSHLSAAQGSQTPLATMLSQLAPGDLVLLGARPGQGKTRLGLELAAHAHRLGRRGYVFTLDYHQHDIAAHWAALGLSPSPTEVVVDMSDEISADYVIGKLQGTQRPALIVIDYLQLLDQRRTNPALEEQMSRLQQFTRAAGAMTVVISQIDRSFDLADKTLPDLTDVRLPNPLDLRVFDKACFLHQGQATLTRV